MVSKRLQCLTQRSKISADGRLFTKDTIARVGYVYTLSKKLTGITALGTLSDPALLRRITIGLPGLYAAPLTAPNPLGDVEAGPSRL